MANVNKIKVPSGGHKPRNTLGGHQVKIPSAFEIGSITGTSSKILKTLSSLGDLVSAPWNKTPTSQQYGSEHASKRMKMGHPGPVRLIHTQEEGDSDDVLSGDGNEYGHGQISIDRAPPGTSVVSSLPAKTNPILRTISSEHEILEAMMDSSKHARQAEEEGRRKRGRPKKSQMEPRPTQTPAIDLTGPDAPSNAPYKGTARATKTARGDPFIGASSRCLETGSTSQFFRSKANANNVATEPSLLTTARTRYTENRGQPDIRLSKQFVAVNGKRRGSDVNLSADELAEVDDSDTTSRVPPQKPPRHFSPFNQRGDDTSPTMLSETEPSNIKPTQFTISGRRQVSRPKKQKLDESSGNDGIDLKSIIIGEEYLVGDAKNLGLVFGDDALEVWCNGRKTNEITRKVIQRMQWAADCGRLRLECSRQFGQSDPHIDLELTSEKDVADVMRYIQERSIENVVKREKYTSL